MANWKRPFQTLSGHLDSLGRTSTSLYHSTALFPLYGFTSEHRQADLVDSLEITDNREEIRTYQFDCGDEIAKIHYFYASNREDGWRLLEDLKERLSGIDSWVNDIPRKILPEISIPDANLQGDRDLLIWTTIAYHLALRFERPYFEIRTEWATEGDDLPAYLEWPELRRPDWITPQKLFFPCRSETDQLATWKYECLEDYGRGPTLPEVVAIYPAGLPFMSDFIEFSAKACDILVYMAAALLDEERLMLHGRSSINPQASNVRNRRSRSQRIRDECHILFLFLFQHHFQEKGEIVDAPLRGDEIAKEMGWFSGNDQPNVTQVSRRMTLLFGENPMPKYRQWLDSTIRDVERADDADRSGGYRHGSGTRASLSGAISSLDSDVVKSLELRELEGSKIQTALQLARSKFK